MTEMKLLHKNGVMTGLVESYCLPCDVHLGSTEVASAHVSDPRHREKLDSANYLDSHKGDGIRKVPLGYYCEYCNKLFSTTINVNLHVTEGEHWRNKDSLWLREQGDNVVVLNQLVIDSDSWHGLVDGACALCNTEYLDKDAHKTIAMHLIKLIQSTPELHPSGAIYRKGNDFFHCLICNAVFPLKAFGTHFEQTDHIKLYNECCETFKNITTQVNINGMLTSKVNIQIDRAEESFADIKEISNPKPTENKQAFEYETNVAIKNHEPSLLQTITGEVTSHENNVEESMLNEDSPKDMEISGLQFTNNEIELETGTNKNNIIIVVEDFQREQKSNTVLESLQQFIPNKESVNDKENVILQQPTNSEQILEEETKKVYKSCCEVIITTPEMFYTLQTNEMVMNEFETQQKTDHSHEATQSSISNIKSKNDTLDSAETLKEQKILIPQNNKTLQETMREMTPEKETEKDTLNGEDIIEQQSIKNDFESEIAINSAGQVTTETLQEVIVEKLPHEDETKSVNEKYISENKYSDKEDHPENSFTSNATTEETFESKQSTEDLIEKVRQMPITKREKVKIISRENKIRYREGYTRAYCSICLTNIPSSLKNIVQHVTSNTHKYEAQRVFKFVSDVIPLNEFIEDIKLFELEPGATYAVINTKYCVDLSSYLLMTRYHSYIRCNACDLNLNIGLFEDHQLSETHTNALLNVPVLRSHSSEFVREVQPGFYHCGFCNSYEGSWRALRDHCKTREHLDQKSINSKRLKYILSST